MKLIYFLPRDDHQAPTQVAWAVLQQMIHHRVDLPFTINVLAQELNDVRLRELPSDVERLSFRSFLSMMKGKKPFIFHMPKTPTLMPSKRFLIHFWVRLHGGFLVGHCHGDVGALVKSHAMSGTWGKSLSLIPTVIFFRQLLNLNDHVVVHSYRMKRMLKQKYGVNRISVIPNGIDESWFENSDLSVPITGYPKVFYHGRLEHHKGVWMLIRAFINVKKALFPSAVLYIAGTGPLARLVKAYAKRHGFENDVMLLGHLNRDHLKAYITAADMLTYPSISESFCIAALEALACARGPVFISTEAGISDFISTAQRTKLLLIPPIEEGITEAFQAFQRGVENSVIEQQRNFASHFLWSNIGTQYVQLYKKLVDAHS